VRGAECPGKLPGLRTLQVLRQCLGMLGFQEGQNTREKWGVLGRSQQRRGHQGGVQLAGAALGGCLRRAFRLEGLRIGLQGRAILGAGFLSPEGPASSA
jgi:hypothetical protein